MNTSIRSRFREVSHVLPVSKIYKIYDLYTPAGLCASTFCGMSVVTRGGSHVATWQVTPPRVAP